VLKKQLGAGERICVVPMHRRSLAIGTLRSILRQADVTPDEFMANIE
jgi:predicted RNA binding protein YcfA (HicA-like mRNA interferase family)